MTHYRTYHYDDRLAQDGGPNDWCVYCHQLDGAVFQAGTEPALPLHQPGHNPHGDIEAITGWCQCFYSETYVDDHDPNMPTHTHQDLLGILNSFDPWLDQMDATLSIFAQALLDLKAQV